MINNTNEKETKSESFTLLLQKIKLITCSNVKQKKNIHGRGEASKKLHICN